MALEDIRIDFVRLSGRHDLVADFASGNYVDNGANFFINMGQKMLDRERLNRIPKNAMRYQKNLTAGQFVLDIENVRAVKEVWAINSTGRILLTKRDIGYLRTTYKTAWGSYTRGTPVDWAIGVNNLAPQQDQLTSGVGSPYTAQFSYDYEDLIFSDEADAPAYGKTSIIVMPPVDETYTVAIWGQFFQKKLLDTVGNTKNYWTEVQPEVLVLAALWAHEVTKRNTEGANDWMMQITKYLDDILLDVIDEEVTGFEQIPG